MSTKIDRQSDSRKLYFADFVKKLAFGLLTHVGSLRMLAQELASNPTCHQLGLDYTPFSTLKDGFNRFSSQHLKALFEEVIGQLPLYKVPHLAPLGLFKAIDGSLFPTVRQMSWTTYRKHKNAFKLHLSFDLNRMIPTEFWIDSGKSCERTKFIEFIQAGVTYIADKGYFSFELVNKVVDKAAFFLLRVKDNLLFEPLSPQPLPAHLPPCFQHVSDRVGRFCNDPHQQSIRLIEFEVWGSRFRLVTNRFDLSILQLIILYAYRWQIELFFKYFKRTLHQLHLFNHSENGVQIQFYLMMLLGVVKLNFKQGCQAAQTVANYFQHYYQRQQESVAFFGS